MNKFLSTAIAALTLLLMFAFAAPPVAADENIIRVPEEYPTIQAAIDAASPGDVVLVAPGTYTESITLKSGVTVRGSGADVTVIDGSRVRDAVLAREIAESTITGFTIIGGRLSGIRNDRSSMIIENNIIHGGSTGSVVFDGSDGVSLVRNNVITNTRGSGILGIGTPVTIVNNVIIRNGSSGIEFWGSPITVTNNTIANNSGSGIVLRANTSATITNNVITGNVDYGICSASQSNIISISYNDVWGNGVYYDGVSPGPGDISADPLFVNPAAGDYHLQDCSPCIDAGTNDAPALPPTDFDGNPRIADGNWDGAAVVDMGAFEYQLFDTTPPVTGHELSGTQGNAGWWVSDVTVTLTATDDLSGVDKTMFRIDGGEWQMYSVPFIVGGDGTHSVGYYSVDIAGNEEAIKSIEVKIDTTLPVSSVNQIENCCQEIPFVVSATATDALSGVGSVELYYRSSTNGGNWSEWKLYGVDNEEPYEWSFTAPDGSGLYEFYSVAVDVAGNVEEAPEIADASCEIGAVIQATVDIKPDTLNLRSHDRWVWAYIELPPGYGVEHVRGRPYRLDVRVRGRLTPGQQETLDALTQEIEATLATVDIEIDAEGPRRGWPRGPVENRVEVRVRGYLSERGRHCSVSWSRNSGRRATGSKSA